LLRRARHSGGPVPSNGVNPVSIAVHGALVYVANAGTSTSSGATNYTGFTLNPGGHLRPLPGSTVTLPDGSQPGDVLFSSDGSRLVGTRVATSLIDSFAVDGDGLLTAAAGSPFAAQGLGPFGSEFRPTNPAQLYVANAHDGTNAGTVSAFTVSADGTLTPIAGSPFPDNQTAPCWVEISHDGRYLFTVNTGSKSISSYSIAAAGSLSLLQSTPLNAPAASPQDARLSPDGSTPWVADLGPDGRLGPARHVAGGPQESVVEPEWNPQGILHFVSDRSGWWNLYRERHGQVEPLLPMAAEFADAPWGFDYSSYAFVTDGHIACRYRQHGRDRLTLLDPEPGRLTDLPTPYTRSTR